MRFGPIRKSRRRAWPCRSLSAMRAYPRVPVVWKLRDFKWSQLRSFAIAQRVIEGLRFRRETKKGSSRKRSRPSMANGWADVYSLSTRRCLNVIERARLRLAMEDLVPTEDGIARRETLAQLLKRRWRMSDAKTH